MIHRSSIVNAQFASPSNTTSRMTLTSGPRAELIRVFEPLQGQLLGAGRPANRAWIQLICSLTEFLNTALALSPGYLTKSTRTFCPQRRATTGAVRSAGTSGSVSPLINSKGPWRGFQPGVFLTKNSLTYRLFFQPGFNISLAASPVLELASQS
jgi:hypothetical protein